MSVPEDTPIVRLIITIRSATFRVSCAHAKDAVPINMRSAQARNPVHELQRAMLATFIPREPHRTRVATRPATDLTVPGASQAVAVAVAGGEPGAPGHQADPPFLVACPGHWQRC
eukprot:2234517-Prymnesium_polylepis.2